MWIIQLEYLREMLEKPAAKQSNRIVLMNGRESLNEVLNTRMGKDRFDAVERSITW